MPCTSWAPHICSSLPLLLPIADFLPAWQTACHWGSCNMPACLWACYPNHFAPLSFLATSPLGAFRRGQEPLPALPWHSTAGWCLPSPARGAPVVIFYPVQYAHPMNEWMSNQRCFREGITIKRTQMVWNGRLEQRHMKQTRKTKHICINYF